VKHLVVGSYNIHRGVGLDRRLDLDRIAAVVAEIGPDVIGLQEVIRENGAAHRDQAAYLANRLDMTLVMGVVRPYRDGTYGNAVLSRLPVLGWAACDLSHRAREPRACLRVDLDVDGRALHVFNCHFGLALRERRRQVDRLAGFIRDAATLAGPRVLMGDFNEWHPGPVSRTLRREFSSPMRRMRRTHPALFPLFALDRLYWDVELEGEEFHVHRTRLARVASDHLPIVARLRVRRAVAARREAPYVIGEALPPSE
jgi:endonuclease/exonuclease/phosphatase family metal-dependent hydrolase